MPTGAVEAICIGPQPQGPMRRVESVTALAGRGIEGDRYFDHPVKDEKSPGREVTLVAKEGIEAASDEAEFAIDYEDTRRNVVTTGIDLQELIGARFFVGDVQLEGIREAAPCKHLESLTGKPLRRPLMGRAGIRARIVTDGRIAVGDEIRKES